MKRSLLSRRVYPLWRKSWTLWTVTFSIFSIAAFLFPATCLKGEQIAAKKNAYALAYDIAVQSVVSIRGEKHLDAAELQKSPLKGKVPEKNKHDSVTGMGSGVIVDQRGYIVTNYHVVKGLQNIQVTTFDETLYHEVEFVSYDPKTDLALLKVEPINPLVPIRFGKISEVYVCEDVMAIGNPFGYSGAAARGIVSGLNRPLTSLETASYDSVIQTDAAINPGNSGGPLVNLDGEMIGINAAVRDDAQNIAFAIPVDMVANIIDKMMRISVAKMTHHGLTIEESDSVKNTVVVTSVEPNSPAAEAGVQAGDILVQSNNLPIHSRLDFTRSLIDVSLADTVEVVVQRNNSTETLEMAMSQLADPTSVQETSVAVNRPVTSTIEEGNFHPASASPSYSQNVETDVYRNSKEGIVADTLGVTIEPVSSDEYHTLYPDLNVVSMESYKIMPSGGVRVKTVRKDTVFSAGKSSIHEGDLIFGFVVSGPEENRWEVTSLDNLYFIARKWNDFVQAGSTAKIYLIRNGVPYFLDIPTR